MRSRPTAAAAQPAGAARRTAEDLREAWREAREEAAAAYRRWSAALVAERRTAYAVYLAAADREDAAEAAFRSSTIPDLAL
jgi:hypothetical protein